jgi:hypothetical protein
MLCARVTSWAETRIVLGGAHIDMISFCATELEFRLGRDLGQGLVKLVLESFDGLGISFSIIRGSVVSCI